MKRTRRNQRSKHEIRDDFIIIMAILITAMMLVAYLISLLITLRIRSG